VRKLFNSNQEVTMSTFDSALLAESGHGPTSVWDMCRRITIAAREAPGVLRGLWQLARKFLKVLMVLAVINIVISILGLLLAWVLGQIVGAIGKDAAFSAKVMIIVYPIILIAIPHDIGLQYIKDRYTVMRIRPLFNKFTSMLCIDYQWSLPDGQGDVEQGPAMKEGRDAAYEIIETCANEPFTFIKGLISIWAIIHYGATVLLWVVAVGVVIDVCIWLKMRGEVVIPLSRMQTNEYRVDGLGNEMLRNRTKRSRAERDAYAREWDRYIGVIQGAELPRMKFETLFRPLAKKAVVLAISVLALWLTEIKQINQNDFFTMVALANNANDPSDVILNFLWRLAKRREQLRRFGLLANIDFGLVPPEQTTAAL
jgi:hypothetical protein